MLSRGTQLVPRALFQSASRLLSSNKDLPIIRHHDAKKKELDDILEKQEPKLPVTVSGENEASEISGVPLEHQFGRTARIFKPSRAATQTAWNNTKIWKIELDNRGRWENPLMGWSSTGDPLSNISMQLDFASKEDAVEFCEKNNWSYDVEEARERQINPKNYGSNFSWNRRTKISTK